MLIPTRPDDPRLLAYHEIKEKSLVDQGLFIAEGEQVVLRLLRSPRVRTQSVLLAETRVEEIAPQVPAGVPTYVLSAAEVSGLLGFKFHSGIIAVGEIPESPRLESVLPATGPAKLVVLPEISAADNLGTLIRLSAGLGADALLVGERCSSPWLRRTVRVSMGTAFYLPIVESKNVLADLTHLRDDMGITSIATVLHPDAEVLGTKAPPERVAVLFGSEGQGLRADEVAACPRKVTIPMSLGVDSLNVGISAAIILFEFFKRPR